MATVAAFVATQSLVADRHSIYFAGPTAELDLAGTTLLARLVGQLGSLGITDCRVICRPWHADTIVQAGYHVIESADLAGDLRAIAELAETVAIANGADSGDAPGVPMGDGAVVICNADVVAHREALARVVFRRAAAVAVVRRHREARVAPTRPVVRLVRGRIVSAGSPYHQVTNPNALFGGVFKVSGQTVGLLAAAAQQLADLVEEQGRLMPVEPVRIRSAPSSLASTDDLPVPAARTAAEDAAAWRSPAGVPGAAEVDGTSALGLAVKPSAGPDAASLCLVGMARSGAVVSGTRVIALVCERALSKDEVTDAQERLDAVNEERIRLKAAVKRSDGFFTTFFVSTYSRYLARLAARLGLTPNAVTLMSMALGAAAAAGFALGSRRGLVAGACLLYAAFVFDCVDGQLARYTRHFSTLGAWLDATLDRVKEYLVYAGLAVGALASGVGDIWGLAIAAMGVQTVRHMTDFGFGAGRRRSHTPRPLIGLDAPDDAALDPAPRLPVDPPASPLRRFAIAMVRRQARASKPAHWFKKIVALPIGERFALIAVTAAVFNARVTFVALIGWGVAAMVAVTGSRLLRALAR